MAVVVAGTLVIWSWVRSDLAQTEALITANQASVPPQALRAILAVEDPDFLSHSRFRTITTLFSSFVSAARSRPLDLSVGHASLTDQIVKWQVGDHGLKRIGKEVLISAILDTRGENRQIATAYSHTVYLGRVNGRTISGLEAGAKEYFGEAAEQLSVAQLASLVAAIRAPALFAPNVRSDRATQHRRDVLGKLVLQHIITPAEAQEAEKEWASTGA